MPHGVSIVITSVNKLTFAFTLSIQQESMYRYVKSLTKHFEISYLKTGKHFHGVDLFWVVMTCSVVVGYQRFGGPCCHHYEGEGTMDL
jgi:hypothetical protein